MKKLKLYGERNSNTNYLSHLIRLNLRAEEVPGVVPPYLARFRKIPGKEWVRDTYFRFTYDRNLGWKHSVVLPVEKITQTRLYRDNDLSFVTLTKNPYSWLLSLHRRTHQRQRYREIDFRTFLISPLRSIRQSFQTPELESFLECDWNPVGRDNLDREVINPVQLWNLKNASYLRLSSLPVLHFRSEDTLDKPEAIIQKISSTFGIERRGATFVDYKRSTKDASKDASYYKDYYLNERWKEELSDDALEAINSHIDVSLMSHFGYEVIS